MTMATMEGLELFMRLNRDRVAKQAGVSRGAVDASLRRGKLSNRLRRACVIAELEQTALSLADAAVCVARYGDTEQTTELMLLGAELLRAAAAHRRHDDECEDRQA